MVKLTDDVRRKVLEPNFWHLATLNEDGSPQVSPVWLDVDDGRILVNTVPHRRKARNLRRDGRVALSMHDSANAYDRIEIRGRVVEWVEGERAERHIDALAKKYMGVDTYPYRTPEDPRVLAVVEPTFVRHDTP